MTAPNPKIRVLIERSQFRKSSFSTGTGDCVEVSTDVPGWVGVRDSKLANSPVLVFSADTWRRLLNGLRSGEMDA